MVDASIVAKLAGNGAYSNLRWSPDDKKIAYLQDQNVMVVDSSGGEPVRAADLTVQGFTWAPDNSGLIVSTQGELWFVPRKERGSPSQLTFGELSYESPDISPAGSLVVSRRGLSATGVRGRYRPVFRPEMVIFVIESIRSFFARTTSNSIDSCLYFL